MNFPLKFFLGAFLCVVSRNATVTVYNDVLTSGWVDASYSTTRNYCATPVAQNYQLGTCALSVQYNSAWSGWAVNSPGVNVAGNNAISFIMHGIVSPALPEIYLTLFGSGNIRLGSVLISAYIPGGLITTGWQRIEIPLVDLNAVGQTITTIDIESNMQYMLYFDDIKFTTLIVPDQSVAYKDNPIQNPGVNFTFGWRDTSYGSWSGTRNFSSQVYLTGSTGIQVYYPTPWTGFSLTNSFGVDTRGKNILSFAVHGGTTGGQDLYVVLASPTNPRLGVQPVLTYIPGHNMVANQWYQVNIPLADLGGVNTVINRISIESATSTIVYYDDISIDYQDPFAFFSNGVGAKWTADTYGASADYNAPIGGRIPYDDGHGLQVNYTMPWGGLYISDWRSGGGVNTTGKYNVVLSVNGGPTGGQDVYLSLYGVNTSQTIGTVRLSNYLFNPTNNQQLPAGTPLSPNTWYDVVIPLSALNATYTTVTRIGLECDRISSVWFDDIRIGGFLRFPLMGVDPSRPLDGFTPERSPLNSVMDHNMLSGVTAYTGETANGSSQGGAAPCYNRAGNLQQELGVNGYYTGGGCNTDKTYLAYDGHMGIDYRAVMYTYVFAAAAGTVVFSECNQNSCSGFGTVTIDHGNGYLTRYLHLDHAYGNLSVGSIVAQGQQIGYSGSTGTTAPHLHFEVRNASGNSLDPYGWQGEGSFTDPYFPSTTRLWR